MWATKMFEMIDANKNPKEKWLQNLTNESRGNMKAWFETFERFTGKTATELIETRRAELKEGSLNCYIDDALVAFFEALTKGEVQTLKTGRPRKDGKTEYEFKKLSEATAQAMTASVKSFFSYYKLPIMRGSCKKGKKKIIHETRRYLFRKPELQQIFNRANLKEKTMLILGTLGLDASTVVSLECEQFQGKLGGSQIEIVRYIRKKTGEQGIILLTREAQKIIGDYLQAEGRVKGFLFQGYSKTSHIVKETPNVVLHRLCKNLIEPQKGEQIAFHGLRKWFSSTMQDYLPQALIDLCQAHALSEQDKAYIEFPDEKIREIVQNRNAEEALAIMQTNGNALKPQIEKQQQVIDALTERMAKMQKEHEEEIAKIWRRMDKVVKFEIKPVDRGAKKES